MRRRLVWRRLLRRRPPDGPPDGPADGWYAVTAAISASMALRTAAFALSLFGLAASCALAATRASAAALIASAISLYFVYILFIVRRRLVWRRLLRLLRLLRRRRPPSGLTDLESSASASDIMVLISLSTSGNNFFAKSLCLSRVGSAATFSVTTRIAV